ncbi:MAG: NAD-dependent epimerase/dehydratase family protein [Anaerolineales bacterium]|nr:NAD-dependent epimerase/dehydratase family protein [Anaerolineales bacterium]
MANYLITGGAGFIGSHLAESLVRQGHTVRILDNFLTGKRSNLAGIRGKAEVIKGDIRDKRAVLAAVRGMEYVLHHAALVSVAESVERPEETLDININGTLNVLQSARKAGVRRVVMASSCAVYGSGRIPAREDQAPRPLSPYAVSKLAGEALALSFHHSYGLPAACLRYFNVFGPRQDPSSPYSGVIAIFSARAVAGEPVTIYGDGRQTRDFIYVADVVDANLRACESETAPGRAMNVGTGRGRSLLQLRSDLADLLGAPLAVRHAPPRSGDIYHSRGDPALARKLIGFRPRTDFRAGLAATLDWQRGAAGRRAP